MIPIQSTYGAILLYFLWLSSLAFPQMNDFRVDRFTVDQGLSQNQVQYITQDSKGFIWIGTQNGLNRFDGYNFRVYRHNPQNINSLSDYPVHCITEDPYGFLWIGTRDGLNRFDPRTEKFVHFHHDPEDETTISNNVIWSVMIDRKKNVWIATRSGLNKYLPEKNSFERYYFGGNPSDPSQTNITSVAEDSKGYFWISTVSGLRMFDPATGEFKIFSNSPSKPRLLLSNRIITMYLAIKDVLWIGTSVGLNSLDLNTLDIENPVFKAHQLNKYLSDLPDNFQIRKIGEDSEGNILVGTVEFGLLRLNPVNGNVDRIENKIQGVITRNISAVFSDKSGVLWIGTDGGGLFKINSTPTKFSSIFFNSSESFSDELIVSSVLIDRSGTLWVGTDKYGIFKTPLKEILNGLNSIDINNADQQLLKLTDKKNVTALLEDRSGNIWIGTYGRGVIRYNPSTKSYKSYVDVQPNYGGLISFYINSIYEDVNQDIWIGTGTSGIMKLDKNRDEFITIELSQINYSAAGKEVHCIIEDKKNNLWFGTTLEGLYFYDRNNNSIVQFKHEHKNPQSISSNRINSFYKDDQGNLWIATFGGGLNRYNDEDKSFTHFSTDNGLPSNIVWAVLQDDQKSFWLSTDKGLCKFDPENLTAKNYDQSDGIASNEFSVRTADKYTASQIIIFGGKNGLTLFNPSKMIDDKTLPAIALTDFKILNKSVEINETGDRYMINHISYADKIHIPHQDNVISFEFAALHFVNPERNQYAYKLEGFDTEWIYSGSRRFVTYTNLDPGKYILKIKATNSDGVWNEDGISLTVIVDPPWWQSWWAYILYAVFIVSILYSLRQYEMKRVKLRNELQLKDFEAKKLQEVDQLKSHFFANISHEFRTPLTLILGLLQKFESKTYVKKDLEDYGIMKRNAVRLLQLINQLLELSKIESGKSKLSASESDIVKFTKRIFVSFASYAEQKNIKLRFNGKNINEETSEGISVFFDNDKMEKIISNLISNAVKYTPADHEIDVKIYSEDNYAQIKVINTGVTISKADLSHLFDRYYKVHRAESGMFEGTGIGLALVKELVELHKGTISVISEYDVTEFIVKIPLGKAHLKSDDVLPDTIGGTDDESFGYLETEIAEELSLADFSTGSNSGDEIILVVEDHVDLRNYIRDTLTDTYQVIEASNGKEGLNKASEIIPDLVISDVMMPEMDGYTFCKKIKSNDKTNHIPVILLTAKASTEDKLEGLELGADDYLIKPFNPDELKLRVRNLIRIREELRQKFTSEMVLKPAEVIVPSSQVQFMERVKNIIEANMENENFGVDKLADEAGMSRSQLHRKLKAITNQSTTEFIRNFRLQRAAQLILQDAGSMAEIAYKVGFNSQAYFNKSFQELFGCSPSEYKRK